MGPLVPEPLPDHVVNGRVPEVSPVASKDSHSSAKSTKKSNRWLQLNSFVDDQMKSIKGQSAKLVWFVIFRHTNNGIAKINHQRIADSIGVSTDTVKRAINTLKEQGSLKIVHQGGWNRGPSTYSLEVPELQGGIPAQE